MKKDLIIFILILILAVLFRAIFINENFFGEDAYYHYSIVRQSLERGRLSNANDLDLCYSGFKGGHPIGYYIFHYYFAKIFGLDTAFYIMPVIFGLISIILAFFVVKRLFNKRIAYFTIFLMAISLSFVFKTLPRTFRGEPIVYPFFLLGLLFSWEALNKKDIRMAILSGFILGLISFFWNGYILVLISANFAIIAFFLYNYFKKIQKKQVVNAIVIIALESLTISLIAFAFMTRILKGFIFATRYLPLFSIFLALVIVGFYITQKFTFKKKMIIFFIGILIMVLLGFIFKEDTLRLLHGMGSLVSIYKVFEMRKLDFLDLFGYFGPLFIYSLIGLYPFFRDFSEKKAYFLGAFIPALYAVFLANRFIFFSSFFILCFSAIAFDFFLSFKSKKKNIMFILVIGLIIISLVKSVDSVYLFTHAEKISKPEIAALKYFGENTPKRSCLMSAFTHAVYYYSNRYSYLCGLCANNESNKRVKQYADFMLGDYVLNFSVENLYVGLEDEDIDSSFALFKSFSGKSGLEGSFSMKKTKTINKGEYTLEEYYDAKAKHKKYIVKRYGDRLEAYRIVDDKALKITHVFDFDKEYTYNTTYEDCFYSGNYTYYVNEKACNTIEFRMLVGKDIEGMKKWYSTPNFKIYKILPPSS